MKKNQNIIRMLFCGLVALMVYSCQQAKDFLEKPVTSDTTIDDIFASREFATKAMLACYLNLPFGLPTMAGPGAIAQDLGANKPLCCIGQGILDDLTDLMTDNSGGAITGPITFYYPGNYNSTVEQKNPSYVKYSFTTEGQWEAIRRCWTIIENIDKVPDMDEIEKLQFKAEARTIIALHYTEMLRHFGGVPKVDHVYLTNENLNSPRMTVREMLDWINELIEESYNDLPYKYSDPNQYGRMTRIGALAIRVRAFHFAASPLFNDDQPYLAGAASDAYYCWLGKKDPDLWKQTRDLADELITDAETNGYGLEQPVTQDVTGYRLAYQNAYHATNNIETLITTRSRNPLYQNTSSGYFMGFYSLGAYQPTQNWIDMFPMANGFDIKSDQPNYAPGWDEQKPTDNRDPRLYESVAVNNGDWGKGGNLARLWQGGAEQKNNRLCYHGTTARKFSLGGSNDAPAIGMALVWPYIRLAEIYLIYAEAANQYEGSPSQLAYARVNAIRARVGLSDLPAGMGKDKFHDAVMKERCCEFGMESVRWFDIVRWKMADVFQETLRQQTSWIWVQNSGYVVAGKTQATRANSYTGDYLIGDGVIGQNGVIYQKLVDNSAIDAPFSPNVNFDPTKNVITYQYSNFPEVEVRAWAKNFSPKWYLSAFPMNEVNMGYGLIQNPGW